jgi:hypothetical protein
MRKLAEPEIGKQYGKWTVIEYLGIIKGRSFYKLRCECGFIRTNHLGTLKEGRSTRCRTCQNKFLSRYKNACIKTCFFEKLTKFLIKKG